ncbi:MAG: leucyl aminopeptidase [Acidimicrobiales bacterium]|nr:leucyl aminopeptidase [Acidimicrobiales bacterium]RZV45492.1 MAG: leucyl aminopeptidase [Acidimicrobiales bacterium]
MPLTITTARSAPATAELVGIGVFSDRDRPKSLPDTVLDSRGFEGTLGKTMIVESKKGLVAAVGLGAADDFTANSLRTAGASFSRAARRHKNVATSVLADAVKEIDGLDQTAAAQALAEGLELGHYEFTTYKSKAKKQKLAKVVVAGSTSAGVKRSLAVGAGIAEGQMLARTFVNEPGGTLTPPIFARRVQTMARDKGLTCKVMDLAAIKKAKLGGLLGVNRGSTNHPRFVELTYSPKGKAKGTLAFVGKGITFDAGGLSIKTGNGMMTMKCDMGGAAAVVGAMSALKAAGVQSRVRAYIPMTDNMLGGDATRPGDVLKIRNGKTIEVLNTDAEGRLVLADALSLASEKKPDAIVDLATLTGACVVALGPKIAGLMSNDDDFAQDVADAADRAGERVWRLPLPDDYKSMFDSPVADMKNIGGSYGGALTAGLILSEFVGEGIPWVHLDIAGPAWTDSEDAVTRKGGTGFGVRTLVDLADNWG